MVEQLAGLLVPQKDIALLVVNPETGIGISETTLNKIFRAELNMGGAKIKVRHHMALMKAVESGNVTAMIWMDKTRFKINERLPLMPLGLNVAAAEVAISVSGDGANPQDLNIARRIAFLLSQGGKLPAPAAVPAHKPVKKPKQAA